VVDLTDFASILSFVDNLKLNGVTRLDSVLMNAGMMQPKFAQTKDGWETMYVRFFVLAKSSLIVIEIVFKRTISGQHF
jgi:NADP-dependent 3-hydroxy acid dehydrogenase YdfG